MVENLPKFCHLLECHSHGSNGILPCSCPDRDASQGLAFVLTFCGRNPTHYHHGDDNEDDDDLNDDDDSDDDGYDDDDDCSVFEAASRISPVQEDTSDDHYGPYWDNSPTCTPYLVMCQTNCQKFSILLLFSKKILPVLLGFLCLAGDWDGS